MELDVNGEVAAVTRSTSGPATFFTQSESSYSARKPVEVDLRGIRMGPTEVSVDNSSRMRGVRTDFDGVPLFGGLARRVSITQYDEHRPAADAEVRDKIAAKAKERVDREATQQVNAAANRLRDELLGPMDSLLLDPMVISAETSEKRFSMRIRLAGADQLGGHTPRPQAPADSLASIQIHESLLNNMLERLETGRPDIRPRRPQPAAIRTDASLSAKARRSRPGGREDHFRSQGRGPRPMQRRPPGDYAGNRPAEQGPAGVQGFSGAGFLSAGGGWPLGQLGSRRHREARRAPKNVFTLGVLKSVFIKIFSDKQSIHMTPESFVKNPKLDGVAVTQFVIDDGWIGAALGRQRAGF